MRHIVAIAVYNMGKLELQTRKVVPKRQTGSNCNVEFMIIVHVTRKTHIRIRFVCLLRVLRFNSIQLNKSFLRFIERYIDRII